MMVKHREYVKLVSNDNHEYYIQRDLAETSRIIRDMLHCPGRSTSNCTVYLHMVNSRTLQKVCHYLAYQKQYLRRNGEIESFNIEPAGAMDLLLVAGFLEL